MCKEVLQQIRGLKNQGYKVGFTASTFELLHPGHIAMLAESKQHCDYLIVGLLTDPTISRPNIKNKPLQSTFERFIQLQCVEYVDFIIPFDTEEDLYNMILLLEPNIRFVGEEYKGVDFTGSKIEGIEIFYNTRKHNYSSTNLRNKLNG